MSKQLTLQFLLSNQEIKLLSLNSKKLPVDLQAVLQLMSKETLGHGVEEILGSKM